MGKSKPAGGGGKSGDDAAAASQPSARLPAPSSTAPRRPAGPPPADGRPRVVVTRIVMPGQANARGTLFGGVALAIMDETAAIVALRHARTAVVTAHIQSVDFKAPILQGEAVEVTATLASVGRTSMRIQVDTWGENLRTGERRFCTSAEFVFVAMDDAGKPMPVPPLPPPS